MAESSRSEIDGSPSEIVNTIILWRIYDVLMLLLSVQDKQSALNLTKMHENGEFLGPNPAFRPEPQFIQPVGHQEEPGK